MRKASTRLPEQGTQAPSPAPDLIPARTENQPRTYTAIGTVNGGTSLGILLGQIRGSIAQVGARLFQKQGLGIFSGVHACGYF